MMTNPTIKLTVNTKARGIWVWPVIVYGYDAADVRHVGEDARRLPTLAIRSEQFQRHYPTGARLTVYVNPDDHRISTATPDRLFWLGVWGIAAAILWMTIASL